MAAGAPKDIALGIDVSVRRVGIAAITMAGEAIDCTTIELPPGADPARWAAWPLSQTIAEFADMGRVVAAGAELPAYPHASGVNAAFTAGRALEHARLVLQVVTRVEIIHLYRPAEWRSLAKVVRLPDGHEVPGDKPEVWARAVSLGFHPGRWQDSADAACVAEAVRQTHKRKRAGA